MNVSVSAADFPCVPRQGIIPPMVTPLRGPDTLDEAGLERLIRHILAGGVHGLFILGTTGEGPSISQRLRRRLIRRVCKEVGGRVPVLVGITDTSFTESLAVAKTAADAGAAAVVAAPPYYLSLGQAELLEYLRHLTARLPLPLMLYNMPSCTKTAFEPETVREAASIPRVVGFKDSSGSLDYFRRLVPITRERPGFPLFMGPEELLADALRMGGSGGVPGGANICPGLYTGLYRAVVAGDTARAEVLQRRVLALSASLYRLGQYASSYIKGIKCALSCLNVCDDFMAEPFHCFREPEREQVRRNLAELGLDGSLEQ